MLLCLYLGPGRSDAWLDTTSRSKKNALGETGCCSIEPRLTALQMGVTDYHGSKPLGSHFEIGAPPMLEPILVGIGMFTGGYRGFTHGHLCPPTNFQRAPSQNVIAKKGRS